MFRVSLLSLDELYTSGYTNVDEPCKDWTIFDDGDNPPWVDSNTCKILQFNVSTEALKYANLLRVSLHVNTEMLNLDSQEMSTTLMNVASNDGGQITAAAISNITTTTWKTVNENSGMYRSGNLIELWNIYAKDGKRSRRNLLYVNVRSTTEKITLKKNNGIERGLSLVFSAHGTWSAWSNCSCSRMDNGTIQAVKIRTSKCQQVPNPGQCNSSMETSRCFTVCPSPTTSITASTELSATTSILSSYAISRSTPVSSSPLIPTPVLLESRTTETPPLNVAPPSSSSAGGVLAGTTPSSEILPIFSTQSASVIATSTEPLLPVSVSTSTGTPSLSRLTKPLPITSIRLHVSSYSLEWTSVFTTSSLLSPMSFLTTPLGDSSNSVSNPVAQSLSSISWNSIISTTSAGVASASVQRNEGNWEWTHWSQCSQTDCGMGHNQRMLVCVNGAGCAGELGQRETKECDAGRCRVQLHWSSWGTWGDCTLECGGGQQYRNRSCAQPEIEAEDCLGPSNMSRFCNMDKCQVDGGFGSWSNWTFCNKPCGGGLTMRRRSCDSPPRSSGGKMCAGNSTETKKCKVYQCEVVTMQLLVNFTNETYHNGLSDIDSSESKILMEKIRHNLVGAVGFDRLVDFKVESFRDGNATNETFWTDAKKMAVP